MKILLISQYALPQPLANAEVVGGVAAELGARGHEVTMVSPVRDATASPGLTPRRAFGWFSPDRASRLGRIAEYLSFTIGALISGGTAPRPDVVVVPSPPPTLGLVGLAVAARHRVPFVYNVQDLYPEIADAVGGVPGPAVRVLRRLVRFVYRRATAVLVIDQAFVPVIEAASPGAVVRPVRNGIDLGPFRGATRDDAFLDELGVPDGALVVTYAGNIGRSQDLDAAIAATAEAGAHLVIHGAGAGRDALAERLARSGHDHVHFSDFRPRSELGRVFASADLHVVPLKAGVAGSSVPSKLLSIFSAGRPVVLAAEAGSAADAVVREAGGGWVVEPGDPQALAAALTAALADPAGRAERGASALAWALDHAGTDRMALGWEAVLAEAVDIHQTRKAAP